MAERKIIHATLVQMDGKGILLTGKSGSGKSDLALRLIENRAAKLVADDMVEIFEQNGKIRGNAPKNLSGLLEVRGVGIVKYPCLENVQIDMVVCLKDKPEDVERMPIIAKDIILGLEINKIDLYAKENSAPEKIAAALRKFGQDAVS